MIRNFIRQSQPWTKSISQPKLGRWQLNDNINRKVDLANIDNCGDRVCGDLTDGMIKIIDLFDKRWKNDIGKKEFSRKIKTKFSLMVNSGSSANLLAVQCLINPYRKKRLKQGDEILIPSLCWSTSLWPIIQSGLKPKFVDIKKETLNLKL